LARTARHTDGVAGGRTAAEREFASITEVTPETLGVVARGACLQDKTAGGTGRTVPTEAATNTRKHVNFAKAAR
jgi:hypothetical protein